MNAANPATTEAIDAQREPYSLRAFLLYFLRLGALGFGGPIALAGFRSSSTPVAGFMPLPLVFISGLRVKKLPEPTLIVGAAMIGIAVKAIPR